VDQYIQRENINLLRKRLLETNDIAARKVLFKLLAEEEAKDDPLKSSWTPWLAPE
jgi:hypothetical protein